MWFDECVFYQIYPLGYCGAERENDFGACRHRLNKIEEHIGELKELGIGAVFFNPLFESERHGYDTVDFYTIDRRLGDNADFKRLVQKLHAAGIRVVLDGVFNHTGRKFGPFQEVLKEREKTDRRFWFYVNFYDNDRYGDGLSYADWEGHDELVKLRLEDASLQTYLLDAVRFWIREFDIDGLRLDVSYLLPPWFLELLRKTVDAEKPEFFLMGEVIHLQNFVQNVRPDRLNSITNYEGFRSMLSAFNSRNLFEIEYSINRLFADLPWALCPRKNLFSFVDNHDVERAATALKEPKNLHNLYTLLFTMPGIPCVYYGSEKGVLGDKSDLDYKLRPCVDDLGHGTCETLPAHIRKLAAIRKNSKALAYGSYKKATLASTDFSFFRECGEEKLLIALNIAEHACVVRAGEGMGEDLLSGKRIALGEIALAPFSACVLRVL